jgi:hypothetical protein
MGNVPSVQEGDRRDQGASCKNFNAKIEGYRWMRDRWHRYKMCIYLYEMRADVN